MATQDRGGGRRPCPPDTFNSLEAKIGARACNEVEGWGPPSRLCVGAALSHWLSRKRVCCLGVGHMLLQQPRTWIGHACDLRLPMRWDSKSRRRKQCFEESFFFVRIFSHLFTPLPAQSGTMMHHAHAGPGA